MCSTDDILDEDKFLDRATIQLQADASRGSRSLTALVNELLDCRIPKLLSVLLVAEKIETTPELVEAVRSVVSAPNVVRRSPGRFAPHIVGNRPARSVGTTNGPNGLKKENATFAVRNLATIT